MITINTLFILSNFTNFILSNIKFPYFLNDFIVRQDIRGRADYYIFYRGSIYVWLNGVVASWEKLALMLRIRGNFSGTINAK